MAYDQIIQSFLLTLFLEMGDRSQLTTIILAAYYRRPIAILLGAIGGHLIATVTAVGIGEALLTLIPLNIIRMVTIIIFIAIGVITLINRESDSGLKPRKMGATMSSLIMTASSEIGDKTWFLAIALAASSSAVAMVFTGVMVALTLTSIVAVILGEMLLKKLRVKWIKMAAGVIFILTGLLMFLGIM